MHNYVHYNALYSMLHKGSLTNKMPILIYPLT